MIEERRRRSLHHLDDLGVSTGTTSDDGHKSHNGHSSHKRTSSDADRPAVKDQQVREQRPLLSRHDLHQILLDFHCVGLTREAQTKRHPRDVRVDHDPLVLPECVAEDDVRRLATDAREMRELVHRTRDLAAVLVHDRPSHAHETLRLVAEEPRALDAVLQVLRLRLGQRGRVGEAREQLRRHHVDAHVRALGGQNRRDEELVGIPVVERALRVRVRLLEPADVLERDIAPDLPRPLGKRLTSDEGRLWRCCARARSHARARRDLARSTMASASHVLSTSEGSSQPFRAMPTPISVTSSPAVECASGPIATVTPRCLAA